MTWISLIISIAALIVSIWFGRQHLKLRSRPGIFVFLDCFETVHRRSSRPNPHDTSYSTYLRVENRGTEEARDIKFQGDFSFCPVYGEPLEYCDPLDTCEFLINGIDQLLPGDTESHKIFSVTGPLTQIVNKDAYENRDSKVPLNVSYKNVSGYTYRNKGITLDFAKSMDISRYTSSGV